MQNSMIFVLVRLVFGLILTEAANTICQQSLDSIDNRNESVSYFSNVRCLPDDMGKCAIQCRCGHSTQLGSSAEIFWESNPNCPADGLILNILSSVKFSGGILAPRWFTGKVQLSELVLNCRQIYSIKAHAFYNDAFRRIKSLRFEHAAFNITNRLSFIGLHSLETLDFRASSIAEFGNGILGSVSTSLVNLTLIASDRFNEPVNVDGLTGDAVMIKLLIVNFKVNLKNTITHKTFTGLIYVTTLDLASCQIEVIGADSFFRMRNMKTLRLQDNYLQTLPYGIFDLMLPNQSVFINIDNNRWHCDCDLCYLKTILNNNLNFYGTNIECHSPPNFSRYFVKSTRFCSHEQCNWNDDDAPTTATSDTITRKCYDLNSTLLAPTFETINIKPRDQLLQIRNTIPGQVSISFYVFSKNFVIIWFRNIHRTMSYSHENINCRLNIKNYTRYNESPHTVFINDLKINAVYIFCLMEKSEPTVSPFNCRSLFVGTRPISNDDEETWVSVDDKELVIGMLITGIGLSVVFGLVLGYVLLRINPAWMRGSDSVVAVNNRSSNTTVFSEFRDAITEPDWRKQMDYMDFRPVPFRRLSDTSSSSFKSYATAINPSRFEIVQRQLELAAQCKSQNVYYLESWPNSVAPIPPNSPPPPPFPPWRYTKSKSLLLEDDYEASENIYSTVRTANVH